MSNFNLYLIGFAIVTIGLAWAAFALGAPPLWIGIGVLVMIGAGILKGVSQTRYRESSPEDNSTKRVVVDQE